MSEQDRSSPYRRGPLISEAFAATDPAARFVVAMAMAHSDINRAMLDLMNSEGTTASPDFRYRIRLITGYLVEAIDSLQRYRETFPEVRRLLARLSADDREQLSIVSGTLQKAGKNALEDIRDRTFHYPSPNPKYRPTSDERLREVLAGMTGRLRFAFNGDTFDVDLSFVDEIAADLATGTATTDAAEVARGSRAARAGAVAFQAWCFALIAAYLETNDLHVGE